MSGLEQRLEALEARLAAVEAKAEIADLMGRYALWCGAGCGGRIVEELWSQADDVSLEYGASGIYEGLWKVKTFYIKEAVPGRLDTVSFSSPSITLSPDGLTAQGSWTAFGTQTDAGDLGCAPVTEESNRRTLFTSATADGRQYRAEVLLQRYAVEFRREEAGWKIRRLHVMEYFRHPYDKDWVAFARERFDTDGVWLESLFETPMPLPPESHGENLPSRATSWHWQYTTDGVPTLPGQSIASNTAECR